MRLALYKPNSKNTGSAASFQISQKPGAEPTFFLSLIAQHSWNDSERKGSFAESRKDPKKTINIKLGEFELGEILHTLETKVPWAAFHTTKDTNVSIRLSTYQKNRKANNEDVPYVCFGLSVTRNGSDKFSLPLEPGEYVRIKYFIQKYFSLLDDARQSLNKRGGQETTDVASAAGNADSSFQEF